jgi:7-cyano-7-deazaguanine synthase
MKALVLLSGGLDSCVALWWARAQGWEVEALSIDFFKRGRRERRAAREVARAAQVRLLTMRLPQVREGVDLIGEERRNLGGRAPDGFIPARNLAYYGLAAHIALRRGARRIVGGHTAEDGKTFPDASDRFFRQLAKLLASSAPPSRGAVLPVMPLIARTKPEVIRLGMRLGAPIHLTWSCYRDRAQPCATCAACRGRDEAFKSAGLSKKEVSGRRAARKGRR